MDGNLQSIFSSLEIIWVLYDRVLNWSKEKCLDDNRDIFILSKGQATLALYTILADKGLFEKKDLESFCKFNSKFSMQADYTKFMGGIELSAGSLGHGFPMAVGVALAAKIKKRCSQIYVLAGDGEMNEGTMWEACLLAADKELDNLCLIIDDNDSIGKMVRLNSLAEKLRVFGFEVYDVDGHDVNALEEVLLLKNMSLKPRAIIAHTIRGYGSKSLMEDNSWFHRAPNEEELAHLLKEVENFA